MSSVFILDACALIALLQNENGAKIVADIYQKANDGNATLSINKINLYEVYYGFYRDKGKEYADYILRNIKQSMIIIHEFSDEVFLEAARFKAVFKISLADSIALAEASVTGGFLLTADHHEFDEIEKSEKNVHFKWIR